MIEFFILSLAGALILAILSEIDPKNNIFSVFFFLLVITILSSISGLRTAYNDTERYMFNFIYTIPDTNIFEFLLTHKKLIIGENPGFIVYQFIIKTVISSDPQIFIFLSSLIINILFLLFYKKYSISYSFSLYLFITSGLFMFGMAAIKQMLSMSIGIWAIHFFLKKKILKSLFILFLATTIHPFILLYIVVFLIHKEVWSKIIIGFLGGFLFLGVVFEEFVINVLHILGDIGVQYKTSFILESGGVNTLRLLVFSVTPILSYIYREKINLSHNKMLIVATNFSIISFMFMLLASHGGANMFGRMATYFEPFIYLVLPWILLSAVHKKYKIFIIPVALLAYSFFFYYQTIVIKLFTYPSLFELLR